MKTFTREQLITGMRRYNEAYLIEPSQFSEIDSTEDCATLQVDNLIKFIG